LSHLLAALRAIPRQLARKAAKTQSW